MRRGILKIFYDWRGPGIWFAEAVGFVWLIIGLLLNRHPAGLWLIGLTAAALSYLFLRICALIRWYEGYPRCAGIGRQFQKGMVPGSYLLFLLALANWFESGIFVLVVALLFLVVAHVNVYLLLIHFRDGDKTPPQLYSSK